MSTNTQSPQKTGFSKVPSAARNFQTSVNVLKESATESDGKETEKTPPKKKAGQLAKVFAEYGTTAVVFHTTISLTSLGICYTAVSR